MKLNIFFLILFFLLLILNVQCKKKKKRLVDKSEDCSMLARNGYCNRPETRRLCPKSCKLHRKKVEDDAMKDLQLSAEWTKNMILGMLAVFVVGVLVCMIKVYNHGAICKSKGSLIGKKVVITGATSGIGYETAYHLMTRGAHVIIGCRNIRLGLMKASKLAKETKLGSVEIKKLDLSKFESVEEFANGLCEKLTKIDILINNAGMIPKAHKITEDGIEETFQVNYLSHFLLTDRLIKLLKNGKSSRIINIVGDSFHQGQLDFNNLSLKKEDFCQMSAYNNSKLAMMLFTQELSRVLKNSGITVNAVNPGKSVTNLLRNVLPFSWRICWIFIYPYTYLFWNSATMAAETTYYCALEKELVNVTGKYFENCKEKKSCEQNKGIAKKLWEISESLIKENSQGLGSVVHSPRCSKSPRSVENVVDEVEEVIDEKSGEQKKQD